MDKLEKESFVFSFYLFTSKTVSSDYLIHNLPVEPDRLLRWIRGTEEIDRFRLNRALRMFETDMETFEFLCEQYKKMCDNQ